MIDSSKEENKLLVDKKRMNFALHELQVFKKSFDKTIKEYFVVERRLAKKIRPEVADLVDVGAEFVLRGGKRIRPAFIYYGYKAAGGRRDKFVIQASMSIELLHAGLLIHDDIVDNSDVRRGKPTVHRILAKKFKNEELGRSLAIVVGDVLLSLGVKVLTVFCNNKKESQVAKRRFDVLFVDTNFGQCLDILGNVSGKVDSDWVNKVMEYKSARYTVEGPLLVGAHLGAGDRRLINALSKYGYNLGIAFQIQDDVLGMFGDQQKVGKPVDSDLKEGKKTLLVIKALEELKEDEEGDRAIRFKDILGNPSLDRNDYLWVQKTIRDTGALDYSQNLAKSLTSKAKDSLKDVSMNVKAKNYLLGIADYMLLRSF